MSDETYFVDGPWQDEPDREEFVHAELRCLVMRRRGHLNGYVGTPKAHPYYGMTDEMAEPICDLDVHGGVTFIGSGKTLSETEDFWWIGFDTAHAFDYTPAVEEIIHEMNLKHPMPIDYQEYRNFEYVMRETRNLAEQLAAMWQPPSYEEWRDKVNVILDSWQG